MKVYTYYYRSRPVFVCASAKTTAAERVFMRGSAIRRTATGAIVVFLTHTDEQQFATDFLKAVDEFNQRAVSLGLAEAEKYYWYHTIDLPHGLVTPGLYDFRETVPAFQFPGDMSGATVLDVGSATGFFAFEFERRGARVVSVELPSLQALDRFPGQSSEQAIGKIGQMIAPRNVTGLDGYVKPYTADELYLYLLEGPFQFCRRLLGSKVERCYASVYDLSPALLGASAFDYVFLGDILVHTLNPLQALAAVAPLCRKTLILSQVMPEVAGGKPAMLYVGGDEPASDEVSWWWPNQPCLVQLLKKLGFRDVVEVGINAGRLRPSGFAFERPILHAVR
jgi:tRNA (mo5U34)-methyltransferase